MEIWAIKSLLPAPGLAVPSGDWQALFVVTRLWSGRSPYTIPRPDRGTRKGAGGNPILLRVVVLRIKVSKALSSCKCKDLAACTWLQNQLMCRGQVGIRVSCFPIRRPLSPLRRAVFPGQAAAPFPSARRSLPVQHVALTFPLARECPPAPRRDHSGASSQRRQSLDCFLQFHSLTWLESDIKQATNTGASAPIPMCSPYRVTRS